MTPNPGFHDPSAKSKSLATTFLADSTLEDGGSVEFLLAFSGGAGDGSGGHDLWVDNIAFTGSIVPVPEPSAALLGLLGTGFFFLRRRH